MRAIPVAMLLCVCACGCASDVADPTLATARVQPASSEPTASSQPSTDGGSTDSADEVGSADSADEVGSTDSADDVSSADPIGGDIDCSRSALTGGDESFEFSTAYLVVDGDLGEVCFGDDDPALVDAWTDLVTITPPGQLGDLVLFAGYSPDGQPAEDTLAFVTAADSLGTGFQMSVNMVRARDDHDELLLTLAHEFTHVFAGTPHELDRTDEAIEGCETYASFDGCFIEGSIIAGWVDEFWNTDMLAELDPTLDSVSEDGEAEALADQRCLDDDGFFGAYAATNPEEDFGEAFSAFVFDVEPLTSGQAERLAWIGQRPGLVEFRDRARAAGLTPLDNGFDVCGS
jgi:hypothetical protein